MEPRQGHVPPIVGPPCRAPMPASAPLGATVLKRPLEHSPGAAPPTLLMPKFSKISDCNTDPLAALRSDDRLHSAPAPSDSSTIPAPFTQLLESPVEGLRMQKAPRQMCAQAKEEVLPLFQGAPSKHHVIEIGNAFYRESGAPLTLEAVPKCVALIAAVHRELAHPPPNWQALNAIVRMYRKGGDITPFRQRHFHGYNFWMLSPAIK